MAWLSILALAAGIFYGLSGVENSFVNLITDNKKLVLYLLMFSVGISVGLGRGIVEKIKEYHIKIFLIPFGIILGSVLGGILCGGMSKIPLNESTAIACGLGWYSLSGIMLTELSGAAIGSIAFLSNLMREIFSFFCIPWIAKHLNCFSCIAPAGATSEDTTLPMLIRHTNEETVVLAVFNGMICSALVPVLIRLCYGLF